MSLDSRIARRKVEMQLRELFVDHSILHQDQQVTLREVKERERVLLNVLSSRSKDVFKCIHLKHYFTPCSACRRNQQDANRWEKFYLSKMS